VFGGPRDGQRPSAWKGAQTFLFSSIGRCDWAPLASRTPLPGGPDAKCPRKPLHKNLVNELTTTVNRKGKISERPEEQKRGRLRIRQPECRRRATAKANAKTDMQRYRMPASERMSRRKRKRNHALQARAANEGKSGSGTR
jgi:hypothetical protein